MRCAIALNSLASKGDDRGGIAQAVRPFPAREVSGALSKRTVSVYSSTPSPSRQPHARQKRISRGIKALQLGQLLILCAFLSSVV
jgi:hypothetical protein